MKILLVGASGIVGTAIAAELSDHEVISASYKNSEYQVDIENKVSIEALFECVGQVDAVISTAGLIAFSPVNELTEAHYTTTVGNKLMGNIQLFHIATKYIKERGSFTFTSGFLAQNPMPGSAAVSMVNAALDAFAKAAALELENTLRVNTVSPRFVKETMALMAMDTTTGISAADTAKAFRRAVEGAETGQAFDVI
jgi:NAD(P)-dependent dehydrogenase (short-subunit alcohol dehydrogenase family)